MKIIQLMPTIVYGDAVSNDAIAINRVLQVKGYDTVIYAENIGNRVPKESVKRYSFKQVKASVGDNDIVIYHGSTGSGINRDIPFLPGRRILRYHNITPSCFFHNYSDSAETLTKKGLSQFENLKDSFQSIIADSSFNMKNLVEMGYHCRMDVCPILIPFEDYRKKPDEETIERYHDGITNILFVGRIAPNKKHEDLIASFYAYQKLYNPDSRLILVGSWDGMDRYYYRLLNYVEELGLKDKVVFSGHVSFSQILGFYRSADLFLCMSEHEGFCVPLVEAMFFRIPIVAYNCCAIEETLGGGGLLINEKKPEECAALMNWIIQNPEAQSYFKAKQEKRLENLSEENVGKEILRLILDKK